MGRHGISPSRRLRRPIVLGLEPRPHRTTAPDGPHPRVSVAARTSTTERGHQAVPQTRPRERHSGQSARSAGWVVRELATSLCLDTRGTIVDVHRASRCGLRRYTSTARGGPASQERPAALSERPRPLLAGQAGSGARLPGPPPTSRRLLARDGPNARAAVPGRGTAALSHMRG